MQLYFHILIDTTTANNRLYKSKRQRINWKLPIFLLSVIAMVFLGVQWKTAETPLFLALFLLAIIIVAIQLITLLSANFPADIGLRYTSEVFGQEEVRIERLGMNNTATSQHKCWEYFGEKIHFLENEIHTTSHIIAHNTNIQYTDIQDLTICYKGLLPENGAKSSYISYRFEGKKYEYAILIDEDFRLQQLIIFGQFLKYKKIPFKCINAYNNEIDLLALKASENAPDEVEEKYLKMIDEIGKEAEK